MSLSAPKDELLAEPPGRPDVSALLTRGTCRLLRLHGLSVVTELALANGRRADIAGLGDTGEVWIVEVKSCLEDFRADSKWHGYGEFCDRFFFAVDAAFPTERLPEEAGLIVADGYGGEILRMPDESRLPAARRKAVLLRIARTAALRLHASLDPHWAGGG